MSEERFEDELREEFQRLRKETSARAPSFERMRVAALEGTAPAEGVLRHDHRMAVDARPDARSREDGVAADVVDISARRRRMVRLGGWASATAAAAAVAAVLLVGGGGGERAADEEFERLVASYTASVGTLRSPTASLMSIPGVDLGSVPSVGGVLRDFEPDPADGRDPEGRDS